MKTLYILRHAKASDDFSTISDIDRPLKPKGVLDASEVGKTLKHKNITPDTVICSNAARTVHTALIVAREMNVDSKSIRIDSALYLPSKGVTLATIQNIPDVNESALIVGHNPDLSNLCSELAAEFHTQLPTCGLVAIRFATDKWALISRTNSTLNID